MRRFVAVLPVLCFAACAGPLGGNGGTGGQSQGSADVSGSFNGQSVVASDAIAVTGTEVADGGTNGYVGIVISSTAGVCARASTNVWSGPPGDATLVIEAVASDATSVGPGTYTVGSAATPGLAHFNVIRTDGTTAGAAGVGTITFTSSGADFEGDFDVTLAGGDRLTGRFSAPVCAGGMNPFP